MTDRCCPVCGIATEPRGPHQSLCLPCTEDEIGETYEQIRDRVTAKAMKSATKKWRVVA